jgi:capsular exopolysaccharide synthesis family protein
MKNLKFDSQKNSNIISVSYETQSPKLAQAVIDKLIQFYLDKHIQVHRTAGSEEFFHQQTEQLRTRLAQTENTLKDLKNQSGIGSVTEQRSILLNRIGSLQRSIEETGAALASSQSKVQAMGKTLAALPKTLVRTKITGYSGNPIDFLQQRLLELQLKEKDLLTTMTDKSRMVQDIKQQIAETQELMGKEGATHEQVNSLALLTERANLAKFRTKAGVLKEELASAQNELKALNDAEVRIAQLEREHEIQKANYRNYSDKLSQARIDRALELEKISNISVVQPASYPVKPIRPRKALNLALGFFLAAFGALGLACSSEYLDHTFQTPEEVTKKLQWPVLAAIPRFIPQGVKGSQGARAPFLLPQSEGWDMAVEMTTQWRLIPANLLGSRSSQETARLLALISCYPGEGVSTVATSLALNLAQQQGGRVLLVDTNVVARPAAHQFLGVDHNTGLAEISTLGPDKTNGILPSSINNLDILPLGHSQANLARFFESRQFTELLNIWKQEYNFVLVDTPALHEAGWVTQLASMANGVVLVIEAEQTRWEVVQQAKEVLEKAHANVLGVVLNKRQFHIPEWLYRTL